MLKSLSVAAAMAFVASPVLAADVDCGAATLVKSAKLKLEACVDPAVWDAGQGIGDQEFAYFSKDGKAGFVIVTETFGAALTDYHDTILQFAAKQSGATAPVKSFDDAPQSINGKDWGSMHYTINAQGQPLEFLNYYYSAPGLGSTQFIFWSLPADAATVRSDLAGKVMPTATVLQ